MLVEVHVKQFLSSDSDKSDINGVIEAASVFYEGEDGSCAEKKGCYMNHTAQSCFRKDTPFVFNEFH